MIHHSTTTVKVCVFKVAKGMPGSERAADPQPAGAERRGTGSLNHLPLQRHASPLDKVTVLNQHRTYEQSYEVFKEFYG